MIRLKFIPLILRQLFRQPTRSLLTVLGVAVAMFLLLGVQGLRRGVADATRTTAGETDLIVYRQDRYCPMASQLPEHYGRRIDSLEGVASVLPVRVVPTNCRASIDVIVFRGVPPQTFGSSEIKHLDILEGTVESWLRRTDAALLSEDLARRRGFGVGDRFDAAGVRGVYVAGIYASDRPQDQNTAYVHLPFLQRNTGSRKLGIVTQFNVRVKDPDRLDAVAEEIDQMFASDQQPTFTSPEKAFIARAAKQVVEIIDFTRYLGLACLAAVLLLVGNAIVLSVQQRIRDVAVLQTLGYPRGLIAQLIVAEGLLMSLAGGLLGAAGIGAVDRFLPLAMSSEGFSIRLVITPASLAVGLGLAVILGVVAGLVPGLQAARKDIAACFRAA